MIAYECLFINKLFSFCSFFRIVWDSMMKGHPSMSSKKDETTPSPIREPTGEYEKNPLFDDNNDEDKRKSQHTSSMSMTSSSSSANFAGDLDNAYGQPTGAEGAIVDPQNFLAAASSLDLHYDFPSETVASTTNFLSGPMVIRVRPDGSPVPEDRLKPLPRDDDREAMTIGKSKIPTVQQIATDYAAFASPYEPYGRRMYFSSYRSFDPRLTNSH